MKRKTVVLLFITCLFRLSVLAQVSDQIDLSTIYSTTILVIKLDKIDSNAAQIDPDFWQHKTGKITEQMDRAVERYNKELESYNNGVEKAWKDYDGSYELISLSDLSNEKYKDLKKYKYVFYYQIKYFEYNYASGSRATIGYQSLLCNRSQHDGCANVYMIQDEINPYAFKFWMNQFSKMIKKGEKIYTNVVYDLE